MPGNGFPIIYVHDWAVNVWYLYLMDSCGEWGTWMEQRKSSRHADRMIEVCMIWRLFVAKETKWLITGGWIESIFFSLCVCDGREGWNVEISMSIRGNSNVWSINEIEFTLFLRKHLTYVIFHVFLIRYSVSISNTKHKLNIDKNSIHLSRSNCTKI